MGYRNLRQCVEDLEKTGQLVRITQEVDPDLEMAEIQRRVYEAGGPAIYYANLKGCSFPAVSNLFGTIERTRFLFRDTLKRVQSLIDMKIDPTMAMKHPFKAISVVPSALNMLPRKTGKAPILENRTAISQLPRIKCWPDDGGAFITLPEVYTENPDSPGLMQSNLGMYRVQLSGGSYQQDRQVGLHYQIHRSIGVHHAAAIRRGEPLKVNIFVGGSPSMILSAVMPLPEGMSELTFAGALGGRAIRMANIPGHIPAYAEADFCIAGTVNPEHLMPEGPFGDHLGYYSLVHDQPVLEVDAVYHRTGAIWPFTVVGRPPQEDTSFGEIIHEITGPVIPTVIAGVKSVHAVDAAGVHPLLLAVGSERYVPYARERKPQELLTCANAILGQGQLSLAKYLMIAAKEDDPNLDANNIEGIFRHILSRVQWDRDLHFQTRTTIDTLDYSGSGFNEGSKLVIAAAGPVCRELPTEIPGDFYLPDGFQNPRVVLPGVVVVQSPSFREQGDTGLKNFCKSFDSNSSINQFPLVVLVDDSEMASAKLKNFLWVTFTRSNPAADIDGIESFIDQKHWGCRGSLVIDARLKPHHAPPLIEDPEITRKVDQLAASGGPLHGIL